MHFVPFLTFQLNFMRNGLGGINTCKISSKSQAESSLTPCKVKLSQQVFIFNLQELKHNSQFPCGPFLLRHVLTRHHFIYASVLNLETRF